MTTNTTRTATTMTAGSDSDHYNDNTGDDDGDDDGTAVVLMHPCQ